MDPRGLKKFLGEWRNDMKTAMNQQFTLKVGSVAVKEEEEELCRKVKSQEEVIIMKSHQRVTFLVGLG